MGLSGREECHDLPAVAGSIAEARSIVLGVGSVLPQQVREDAALLVSELMSNAVRHGGSAALLTVSMRGGLLTVAVHDDGEGLPTMQQDVPDPSVTSGRGLRIVARVARRWGVRSDDDRTGKTVWFEVGAVEESASGDESDRIEEEAENRPHQHRRGEHAGEQQTKERSVWS